MSNYKKLTSCDHETLSDIIAASTSRREILKHFGYNSNDPRAIQFINNFAKENCIKLKTRKKYGYTVEDVKLAISNAECMSDVLRSLGLSDVGGNSITIKKIIKEHNLNCDHFTTQTHRRGKNDGWTVESALTINSSIGRTSLRRLVLREQVFEYECVFCGCDGNWQGHKIALELDHISGDRSDNRKENLRWLCPNCHATTTTFRGRNNT